MEDWAVKLDFVGADPATRAVGKQTGGSVNYLLGPRESWVTGIPSYKSLTYPDLWPGIDLVYQAGSGRLKYDLVVEPKADPSAISMAYRGTESLKVGPDGALRVVTPGGTLVDGTPFAYQDGAHGRTPVQASYRLRGLDGVGFDLGPYDSSRPLVIDPEVLVYGTYLGGAQEDTVLGIAVDRSGSAYATGETPVAVVPNHPGGVPDGEGRRLRRLRHQVHTRWIRAGVLHLHRRAASGSSAGYRRRRRRQRPRFGRDEFN